MRMMLMSGVAILLSSVALPATAAPSGVATANQESSQPGSQTDRSAQPQQRARSSDRQICVNEAMSTGRIRRRVCHTQAEWRALQANDEQ